jgi:hypothetical protein
MASASGSRVRPGLAEHPDERALCDFVCAFIESEVVGVGPAAPAASVSMNDLKVKLQSFHPRQEGDIDEDE